MWALKETCSMRRRHHWSNAEALILTSEVVVMVIRLLLQLHCAVNRDVCVHVHSKSRFFNKDEFLEGLGETERPFYEKVSGK